MLGAIRSLAQRVSYEVVVGTILLCPALFVGGVCVYEFLMWTGAYFGLVLEVFCV
jgi:NADH:ubiquinone oxidoreductase subunit H